MVASVDPSNLDLATMTSSRTTRITVTEAALHYNRSRRWVRMQVSLLTDGAKAALRPGTCGRYHERDFDRRALIARLDHVAKADSEIARARLGYLAGHVGVRRRRDQEGATLCESRGCRQRVQGRRRLCDSHTTPRARADRCRRERTS